MTFKSLHLSVLLAGLMAAGFATAQTPAPTAVPAAPATRADVKAQISPSMTNKTGEGADVGAPKKMKAGTQHRTARHHMKAKKMKHHRHMGTKATTATSSKTGEAADLGKK